MLRHLHAPCAATYVQAISKKHFSGTCETGSARMFMKFATRDLL